MALMRQAFFWAFLVTLLSLCRLLNAADLSQQYDPQGPLGVRLDYELATRSTSNIEREHRWVFSTHLTFNDDVAGITNGQLRKIAEDAFQEMTRDFLQYRPKMANRKQGKPAMIPAVLTILAFGNEIILSSSQKGQSGFINEVTDSPVKWKLELCTSVWAEFNINPEEPDHKNGRGCGEIMVLHQYYQSHREELSHWDPKPRATTVHKQWKEDTIRIIPPCGTEDDYKKTMI
ncbi:hypothetical protein ACO1O0_008465 [Amphichorda felina]